MGLRAGGPRTRELLIISPVLFSRAASLFRYKRVCHLEHSSMCSSFDREVQVGLWHVNLANNLLAPSSCLTPLALASKKSLRAHPSRNPQKRPHHQNEAG